MKVLVTGAAGNVGPAVVERLVAAGDTVKVIGRRPDMSFPGATYRPCDITDFPRLVEETRGMEGVIHLAAIPGPHQATPEVVFHANCQGSFNVYQAAALAGIRRVVSASSINAVGYGMGFKEWPIRYLPMDEAHPTHATDSYSYSKNVLENIAEFYWQREGVSGACLRIPATLPAQYATEQSYREYAAKCQAEWAELTALSLRERKTRLGELMARLADTRAHRYSEKPPRDWRGTFPDHYLMGTRNDFWTAVDARDSAQAFEKALKRTYQGMHVLFVNDNHNRTGIPSRLLAETFFPEAQINESVQGTSTLVSIERARKLLGYEPEYSASRFFGTP